MNDRFEELDRLLETPGTETGLPSHELTELLVLAGALRAEGTPPPRPEFHASLRRELIDAAGSRRPQAASPVRLGTRMAAAITALRRSAALTAASLTGALAITGVGVVAAADHAAPNDTLYPVKQVTESVRVSLGGSELAVGRLHLQLAERRLDEVIEGAGTLSTSMLASTLARMDERTEAGSDLLLDHFHTDGDVAALREVTAFVERQSARLDAAIADLPVEVVPFAIDSRNLLARVEREAGTLLVSGCVPCELGDAVTGRLPNAPLRCCPAGEREPRAAPTPADSQELRDRAAHGGETRPEDPDGGAERPPRLRGIIPIAPTPGDELHGSGLDGLIGDIGDGVGEVGDRVDEVVDDLTGNVSDLLERTREDLGSLLQE